MKKFERRRIDAFQLRCWRRLFRVPWTARRSNQSIPREINTGYSLEGLMLKLKLQYFDHLMERANSLHWKKTLMLGKIEGKRRSRQQRLRWLDSITDSMNTNLANSGRQWGTGRPRHAAVHRVTNSQNDLVTEQQQYDTKNLKEKMYQTKYTIWNGKNM